MDRNSCGGGGGGGGGGSRGGDANNRLRHERLLKRPCLFRQNLPVTAIERFLGHQKHQFPDQYNVEKNPRVDESSFLCGKSSNNNSGNTIVGGCSSNWAQSGGGETWLGFLNGLDLDGVRESLKRMDVRNTNEVSVGNHHPNRSNNGSWKLKRSQPSGLIKGQWTQEEDRILVSLVMQHGEKNWSQIAKQLSGRVGKQCRERWNNHLRPNIKKDRWSEEEENMLVEAHEKLGNKWSEIAKHIPGRTENAIKNHWNAARRRQNSRRKNKPPANHTAISTVLDDYIKAKNLHASARKAGTRTSPSWRSAATGTALSATSTGSHENLSMTTTIQDPDVANSTLHELSNFISYEEEIMFMQNFFGTSLSHQPPSPPFQQLPALAPVPRFEQDYSGNLGFAYNCDLTKSV